jgi:hypothetical protein
MIIEANTPEGRKAKIYNADGTEVTLFVKLYDTENQTALHYEFDEKKMILMEDYVSDGTMMVRKPVLTLTILPGSYAEIDGKRV